MFAINIAIYNTHFYKSYANLRLSSFVKEGIKSTNFASYEYRSIAGLGRSPGERKGYPLQYFGLENSMDSPWGRKESDMTE